MSETQNSKKYDLEERTLRYVKEVNQFIKTLPKTITNIEYIKQLAKASGSVGANYREANESLSKKDFVMRIKICRKESKESVYWLNLVETNSVDSERKREYLIQEGSELKKIFSSIVVKSI